MAGYDREKMREKLLKRTQEEYSGGNSQRYFKLESDLPLWSPKPTKDTPYIIDIIPYIASKNYPQIDARNPIVEGEPVYRLEIMVHQNIGSKKIWVVCPTINYGKPCPICEHIDDLVSNGKEYDDYSSIAAKRRCAYNVLVYNGKDDNKVQIWEVSYKYSEKPIRLQAKSPRTGGVEPFADPDVGKSISFEVGGDEYKTIQGHKLLVRDYVIPDEILKSVYTLEDEIVVYSYDEIHKIFYPGVEDEDAENEKEKENVPSRRSAVSQEVKKEEDVPDFKPTGCLYKGKFGEDIDKLPECGTCKAYDNCAAEADKIALKLKAERDAKRAAATPAQDVASTPPSGRRLRRPE
jgi:hypothetical protein